MSTPDVNSFLNFLLMSMGSSSRILNHFQSILWLALDWCSWTAEACCRCYLLPRRKFMSSQSWLLRCYWSSRNQFKSIGQNEVTLCIQARSRVLKIIEWHNLTIMRATFHHPIQSCASVYNVVTLIITRCYLSISLSPFFAFLPSFLPALNNHVF